MQKNEYAECYQIRPTNSEMWQASRGTKKKKEKKEVGYDTANYLFNKKYSMLYPNSFGVTGNVI